MTTAKNFADKLPDFSVIIPTRNRPELLKRTLQHVKEQTFRGFEVIVVDDGSDETTLAQYADIWSCLDDRFSLQLHSPAEPSGFGPSATRNRGLALARGEYIAFCDDDDYWTDPRHLEIAAEALAAVPEADLFLANQRGVSDKGEITVADWMPHVTKILAGRKPIRTAGIFLIERGDLLQPGGQIGHLNCTVIRRRVIETIGGFWEAVAYEEDREFLLRACDCARYLLFRSEIVAAHSVPDPVAARNASTQLAALDKWLVRILTSQHVLLSARSAEVTAYARMLAGHGYRHVAQHFLGERRYQEAVRFARCALAMSPNWRWYLFTLYLSIRALTF